MNNNAYFLPYAEIQWQANNTPYAPLFNDIYFSKTGGLEEKQHVFVNANQLQEKWQQLHKGDRYTILEAGFGFGLNFMLTSKLWRSIDKPENCTLYYIAFEQHLIKKQDLQTLNQHLPNNLLQPLIDQYPLPIPGTHHIWFQQDICLTLIIGDISEHIEHLTAEVDSCFLDGFSPAKNQQMWLENIYQYIFQLMRTGGSFSSYSVAGHVRRGLSKVGFTVKKVAGHGAKAEMMIGHKPGTWRPNQQSVKNITLIGAGLAGMHCQQALAKRNIACQWYEAESRPLGAVQHIKQLGIYPQLSASPQIASLFSLRAFEYLRTHFDYNQTGRLQLLASSQRQKARQLANLFNHKNLQYLTATQVSSLAGITIKQDALYYPTAGWINPQQLSNAAYQQPIYRHRVKSIERSESEWLLKDENNNLSMAETVILATGAIQQNLLAELKLVPVRGQSLSLDIGPNSPKHIISEQVSLYPDQHGEAVLSASFDRNNTDLKPSPSDTKFLLAQLNKVHQFLPEVKGVNVGIRATTRDRLPVIGPVPDWQALANYCNLPESEQQRHRFETNLSGLYCMVGFGAHGATNTPLCAETLIRTINREPTTAMPELAATRFALRDARKR